MDPHTVRWTTSIIRASPNRWVRWRGAEQREKGRFCTHAYTVLSHRYINGDFFIRGVGWRGAESWGEECGAEDDPVADGAPFTLTKP